jgi:hypothetical protein
MDSKEAREMFPFGNVENQSEEWKEMAAQIKKENSERYKLTITAIDNLAELEEELLEISSRSIKLITEVRECIGIIRRTQDLK